MSGAGSPGRRADSGSALTESFDALMDLGRRCAARPVVPAGGVGAIQARTKAGWRSSAPSPDFSPRRCSTARCSAPIRRVASRRFAQARRDDAEDSSRSTTQYVPDHAVLAFAGESRCPRRGHSSNPSFGPGKNRRAEVDRSRRPGGRRVENVISSPGRDRSRRPGRRHSGDEAHQCRLHGWRSSTGSRGHDGAVVPPPARGKGVHVRIGSGLSAATSRRLERLDQRPDGSDRGGVDAISSRRSASFARCPSRSGELADAKRSIVAVFALSLDRRLQILGLYLDRWRYGLPADYWGAYAERIAVVTENRCRRRRRNISRRDASRLWWSGTRRRSPAFSARRGSSRSTTRTASW